ncbi:hypothetical protein TpMuguga_02g00536 [Theileria parva strain Muguga]|uniref:uncharacterized protein n=1 Tax=Theileria parva strain Muguga TaxID=333668 RepID=UPI001C6186E6|nr:uncharacterized protein TpMuguga_02g00536 [Theileria parva strain Muguga]EAN32819.2 hypothetical protein TpMuguga_02g00536 [Theileria parva strain Muguga]
MYSYVYNRKIFGDEIPPSIEIRNSSNNILPRFLNHKPYHKVDLRVLEELPANYPIYCREISEVKEIIFADEIVAVLMKSGLARAFNLISGVLKCELNPHINSIHFPCVHTIVYNKKNDTLIIAYSSLPSHLQCKVIYCHCLNEGKIKSPTFSFNFEQVILSHPAYFEFCENNKRIAAADLTNNTYKFWDMITYTYLYEIKGRERQEIRVSDGLLVMLDQPNDDYISLSLFDIENGAKLVPAIPLFILQIDSIINIIPKKPLQFLELLVSQILIKQEGQLFSVIDILRNKKTVGLNTIYFKPRGFVFFDAPYVPPNTKSYEINYTRRFFTISSNSIEFWQLSPTQLTQTTSINVPGVENPDLCCHSIMSDMFCIKCLDPDTLTRVESNSESTPLNSPKLIYPFSPRKISILNHLNRFLRVQHSTGVSVCLTDFTGFVFKMKRLEFTSTQF